MQITLHKLRACGLEIKAKSAINKNQNIKKN